MKKAYRIRMLSVFVPVFSLAVHTSPALAGFYVIPAKTDSPKTVVVSHTGSDTESGAALLAALDKITDASESNPHLIVIKPGAYNIGDTPLQMKPYVSVQGFGQDATTIAGNVTTAEVPPDIGTVMGADNSELTRLTVRNTGVGAGVSSVAVCCNNVSDTFKMTHMTAKASGGTQNYGVFNNYSSPVMANVTAGAAGGENNYGVYNASSSPAMENITAEASWGDFNYGVYNASSSPAMTNITTTATWGSYCCGVYQDGGTVEIAKSDLSGEHLSVFVLDGSVTIARTRLDGSVFTLAGGVAECKCVCDASDNCYTNTCP